MIGRLLPEAGLSSSSSSLLLPSLELSDTRVYEPYIRARLGTAAHLFEVVVLKLRAYLSRTGPTHSVEYEGFVAPKFWGVT